MKLFIILVVLTIHLCFTRYSIIASGFDEPSFKGGLLAVNDTGINFTDMKLIPLTRGFFAKVDDADFEMLNKYKWHVSKSRNINYAKRNVKVDGKWITTDNMHQQIMNTPKGKMVDHRDGDGLNNQRDNLRIVTTSQNCMNAKVRVDSKTGYKGVSKSGKKYAVHLGVNSTRKYLGCYATAQEGAKIYNKAALKYFGEFARLNVI